MILSENRFTLFGITRAYSPFHPHAVSRARM
jgi:hypothetical protein